LHNNPDAGEGRPDAPDDHDSRKDDPDNPEPSWRQLHVVEDICVLIAEDAEDQCKRRV
jgi:hypothetical protein